MPKHEGRILITGFGIVAQALMPLIVRHLGVPCSRIAVIEFARRPALEPWLKKGVRLVRERGLVPPRARGGKGRPADRRPRPDRPVRPGE